MSGHFSRLYASRRATNWLIGQEVFDSLGESQRDFSDLAVMLDGFAPSRHKLTKRWRIYGRMMLVSKGLFCCQDYSAGPPAEFEPQDQTSSPIRPVGHAYRSVSVVSDDSACVAGLRSFESRTGAEKALRRPMVGGQMP
jgi:hypothetical protein